MNEGLHLDLDTWIVPGQIRKENLCRGLGNRYTPAGTEVLILMMMMMISVTALCRGWSGPIHCPAEVGYLAVRFSWPSALHCNPCPAPCSPGNVPTPTPAPLMDITLRQNWSANIKIYRERNS